MDRLKRDSLIWLVAFVASLTVAAAAIALSVLFASKLAYIPLAAALVLAIHGLYGSPFYFIAWRNRRLVKRLIDADAVTDLGAAAEALGIQTAFAEKIMLLAKKHGYIKENM